MSIVSMPFGYVVPLIGVFLLARVVYLCYFHPLAKYQGPVLARFTNTWFVFPPIRAICILYKLTQRSL